MQILFVLNFFFIKQLVVYKEPQASRGADAQACDCNQAKQSTALSTATQPATPAEFGE